MDLAVAAHHGWQMWSEQADQLLVGNEGLHANPPDLETRVERMRAFGVPARVVENTDAFQSLTSKEITQTYLHDAWGGAIRARETGQFLMERCADFMVDAMVVEIEVRQDGDAIVRSTHDDWPCDSVVILAGANTPELASTAGLAVPDDHIRVARYTFAMQDPSAIAPCWIHQFDGGNMWGHLARPGHWAMGMHTDDEQVGLDVPQDAVDAEVLKLAQRYIHEHLDRVNPRPVEVITCVADSTGDGLFAGREGPVLALWGDNHFKFAPVIGDKLCHAARQNEMPALPLSTG
jgi:sarcosine oxidase